MLYALETIAGKEYKLRLTAQACVDVEKRLGRSVLDVLLAMVPEGATIGAEPSSTGIKGMSTPCVNEICIILHGAMQKYHHGVTLEQVYGIYDEHIDAGGSYEDFFGIINEILQVSGFLPKTAPEKEQKAAPEAGKPEA